MAGIIRVARDNSAVIIKVGNTYNRVSADLTKIDKASELSVLINEGTWRRPLTSDVVTFHEHSTLAAGEVLSDRDTTPERQIRMPKSVQRALAENVEYLSSDPATQQYITNMASSTTTTASQVIWLRDKLMDARTTYSSMGGDNAYTWFLKFDSVGGLTAAGEPFEPSDDLEYFGISDHEEATSVTGLIAVNRTDDIVLVWTTDGFIPALESVADFQAGTILEIDPESATAIAQWVNEGGNNEDGFDISNNETGERNLIEMALAERGQWAMVDDAAEAVVAAGPNPLLYTPQEREQNADRQQRAGDGKFGGPQIPKTDVSAVEPAATGTEQFQKATLPLALPLLADVAGRIAEYLGSVGGDIPAPPSEQPIIASATPDVSNVQPLYLAVVDPVDNTAVLEIAAILPAGDGTASAWVRNQGQWVPNNDLVADLQGVTPPPVVELTDETTIKDVLTQADTSDGATPEAAPASEPVPVDVPVTASATYFGDFGEILPAGVILAAGVPGISDTPSDSAATERLMRYWAYGPGAAKIRWGTPGDLTRAHRYLAKYVGPKRAWGLAQNLHKRVLGMPNATHDKITGQTK